MLELGSLSFTRRSMRLLGSVVARGLPPIVRDLLITPKDQNCRRTSIRVGLVAIRVSREADALAFFRSIASAPSITRGKVAIKISTVAKFKPLPATGLA